MRIVDLRATTVAVPLRGAIRHANGAHWGRFVRTIIEVETDDGQIGIGEMGGGGESAAAAFAGLKPYVLGHDPFDLNALYARICNPTASLYNNRMQLHAALEFACLDLIGKHLGVPVHQLFGGKLRDEVPFASYLFYRYPDPDPDPALDVAEVRTVEQVVADARQLRDLHGFTSHKLKGGVFPPQHELACYRALAEAFPQDRLRYDPNAGLSVRDSIAFGRAIADLEGNDYLEDPTWGLNGMRRVREGQPLLTATNTVIVNFEQLAANTRDPAIDVVLLDTTFWGGIRNCIKAAGVCETVQTEIAVHSSGELGIQLASMLHLGAVLPNLTYAADAHYHHLADDVIVGGKLPYIGGAIAVPTGPGLGVELDRDKLATYAALYAEVGGYPYDRDPQRPDWFARVPASAADRAWDDPDRVGEPFPHPELADAEHDRVNAPELA